MSIKNLFSCLVHEKPEVVEDLVCNLRCLDPFSSILLYNNSGDASLLADRSFHSDPHVFIYPEPKPQRYGALHGYMLDCMRWAFRDNDFDTITNVDSDQLLLQTGYTEHVARIVAQNPNIGMLRSSPMSVDWPTAEEEQLIPLDFLCGLERPFVINFPQYTALKELDAWVPFLTKFSKGSSCHFNGLKHYPRWTFWPGTLFSRRAAEALLALYESSLYLRALIGRSKIFATEEIIFPTLVSLLGFDLVPTPFDETCLRYRASYTVDMLEESLQAPGRFWIHPVPRRIDDPLRVCLRRRYDQYRHDGRSSR